ncbi:ABC transporter ATP-binding protein [Aeoliella mucimassa]|uniref:Putative ABC transporter ATP-binding protein n=1 Tax=Aeoliella mucimassa TaxID=2527972 RepID=A0A518AJ43_9BACT|nr:ATP-binding cassette domain-containing protein [Aeoliella mucimassa]QDU54720.1 putative ABC transporter ATP-binding protein [Aeoliella mucimassa]
MSELSPEQPSNDKTQIAAQALHVQFGRQHVLRDVTIEVPQGQTLAIIGESGCGKTVLLKSLIGLVQPTSGHVVYDGQVLDNLNDKQLTELRTRFGFVFQNAALFDSMTIADNVAFPLREHRKIKLEEAYQAVREALSVVGLPSSVMVKRPAELSGGMRKRVGLARAIIMQPEILLYDEPTTGLDPIMSDVITELILRTRDHTNVTSIVVTHDMSSAMKLADRIVMLYPLARLEKDEPQIIFDGTTAEIQKCKDKRVAQFLRGEAGERLQEMRDQFESSRMIAAM